MTEQVPTYRMKRRVSVFLREHEQWNAWIFFTLMALLVMYGAGPFNCTMLPCALLAGMVMLYMLKLSALYLRRSTAWATTGICFAFVPFILAWQTMLSLCLQVVVLYHVLVWARGKRNDFSPRHFFIAGLAVSISLLKWSEEGLFYLFPILLMVWSTRRRWPMAVGMLLTGSIAGMALSPMRLILPGSLLSSTPSFSMIWAVPSVVILVVLSAVTVGRSRPERRRVSICLAGWLAGVALCVGWHYFIPLLLLSMIGVALLLHRHLQDQRILNLLRALGLLIPFVTLCAALLIPLYRTATTAPAAEQKSSPVRSCFD